MKGSTMKFRVERDVLADAVTWTARTLPTRPPVPVLAGVRLEADPAGVLHLSSFDYEVSARAEVAAEVSEPGVVLVSGRLLAEISRALPAKPVDIALEGDKITLLATDRYRLALRELRWSPTFTDMSAVALVRAKTLSDVAKSLGSAGEVNMALSTGGVDLIGFEAGGRHTTSLLVDGDYPAVRRLFPDEKPIHAVANTQALIDAARRVSLVAERNTPIRLSFSDGQVVLDAAQGDDAQASEAIEAQLVGDDISVAFNPQYLLDGLGALTTELVRLSFTHPNKPVEFTGQNTFDGDDIDTYRYLLVPIRFAA